jgi:hypothetical protein
MDFIDVNSQEHRELMLKAIREKNVYLIQQLAELEGSRCTRIVVIETSYDLLRYTSSYTENAEKQEFMLFADKSAIELLLRTIRDDKT